MYSSSTCTSLVACTHLVLMWTLTGLPSSITAALPLAVHIASLFGWMYLCLGFSQAEVRVFGIWSILEFLLQFRLHLQAFPLISFMSGLDIFQIFTIYFFFSVLSSSCKSCQSSQQLPDYNPNGILSGNVNYLLLNSGQVQASMSSKALPTAINLFQAHD